MQTHLQPPTACASEAHKLSFAEASKLEQKYMAKLLRGKKNGFKSETNSGFEIELVVLLGNKIC